jgi:hypothetical protein
MILPQQFSPLLQPGDPCPSLFIRRQNMVTVFFDDTLDLRPEPHDDLSQARCRPGLSLMQLPLAIFRFPPNTHQPHL